MANILFVTWDGGGNLPPAIGIAAELQRRGDAVRFLGHEQQRNVIEKAGLRFEPYSDQHGFSTTTPESWVRWVRSLLAFVNDRSTGSDMLASVQREPTDLVVIDCVLRSVLQAAEQSRLHRAVLVHSFRPAADRLTGHWTRRPRHHHGSTLPRSADHRAPHGQVHGSAQDRTSTREGRRRMPTPKKIITGTHSDGHRTSSWG
jgi:UDP:flavonoid glycosyltransferase YjiC (YdhE family)